MAEVIADFKRTKPLSEAVLSLSDISEKVKMEQQYSDVLEEYRHAKQILAHYKIVDDAGVKDFDERYEQIQKDLCAFEKRKIEQGEHYRRLKKLEHSLKLAEDPRYIYGSDYPDYEKSQMKDIKSEKELWR